MIQIRGESESQEMRRLQTVSHKRHVISDSFFSVAIIQIHTRQKKFVTEYMRHQVQYIADGP